MLSRYQQQMLTTLKLLMKEWWSLRTLNSSRFFIQHSLFFRSSRISSKDWKVPCKVARLQDSQSTSNIPAHMFQVTLIHRWKVCVQLKIHKFLQRIIRAENKLDFICTIGTRKLDNTIGKQLETKIGIKYGKKIYSMKYFSTHMMIFTFSKAAKIFKLHTDPQIET